MNRPTRSPDRLDRLVAQLRALREADQEAAFGLALELVARERVHRALEPALEVLAEAGRPEARPALRARFFDLAEHGERVDQDCALRVGIVRALAAIEARDDADVAEAAIATVQIRLGTDVAQNLRAEGLLLLALIEPERADFRAVELLQDAHTSTFSGQPAVSAVRVLAKRGHYLPIWAVAHRPGLPADVLAQAFASLRGATPSALQLEALLRHLAEARARGEPGEAVALVAAEAIILNELVGGYRAVLELLRETPNRNLREYLELTIARSGDRQLRELLDGLRRRSGQATDTPSSRRRGSGRRGASA